MFIGIGIGGDDVPRIYSVAEVAAGKAPRLNTVGWYEDATEGTKGFIFKQCGVAIEARGSMCAFYNPLQLTRMVGTLTAFFDVMAKVGAAPGTMAIGEQGWFQIYGTGPARCKYGTGQTPLTVDVSDDGVLENGFADGDVPVFGMNATATFGGNPSSAAHEEIEFNFPFIGNVILKEAP